MITEKDNCSAFEENDVIELALLSTVGGRPDQQDSAGFQLSPEGAFAVICDGMGGHEGGQLASRLAVSEMMRLYNEKEPSQPLPEFLMDAADCIDQSVNDISYDDGTKLQAGTTLICTAVNNGSLHFLSVGDSRIYLARGEELYRLTVDHNYLTRLNMDLSTGKITQAEYEAGLRDGEALVSFIGVGGLSMIDCNQEPLALSSGDRLVLSTDGLYKLIPDDEICSLINNFSNINDAVQALELKARRFANQHRLIRDNMTVAIIKIK